ncbi:MAG: CoA transferase [Rhodospirillaceae bacterium]|nr:CoA transferase [Rhodospirillaceae bacterium]
MTQAFSKIRVLDFSQVVAGPLAAQLLNVLGAEVIKIEQPGAGDQMRVLMTVENDPVPNMSPAFMTTSYGKKSIAINLKSPDAHDVIMRLAATCDVVVENFRAGVIDKLGFGYDAIRAVKPDIVYCSISGYGQSGPKARKPAYDGAMQAASGMMASTGHPDTGPTRTTFLPVDSATGITAAYAIAAALFRRATTGEGQYLDVSMLDSAISVQAANFACLMAGGEEPGLIGNTSPTALPTANCFATADGYVLLVAIRENQVTSLFNAIGLGAMLDDPKFADNKARTTHGDEVLRIIRETLKQQPSDHWVEVLEAATVPVSKVRSLAEVVQDPQLDTRNIITDVPAPGGAEGTIKLVGSAFVANEDGPSVSGPPPVLGEHNDEVLRMLGYTDQDIAALQLG